MEMRTTHVAKIAVPAMRPAALLLTLAAFGLHIAALGAKGFSYDEAASALMARAGASEIVRFHWTAAFEHPPLWQLLVRLWSAPAGQSEFALRFLPALAGTLVIPLVWALAGRLLPGERAPRTWAGALTTLSPTLLLYSQEARMYTLVVTAALGMLLAVLHLRREVQNAPAAAFVLLGWLMTGLHYYSVLVVGLLGFALVVDSLRAGQQRVRRAVLSGALALVAALPIGLWLLFAPGFRGTLAVVARSAGGEREAVTLFLDELWRDLSFGSVRWQPGESTLGYLLLPVAVAGLFLLWRRGRGGWVIGLLVLLPIGFSAVAFGALATRYMLYVLPLLMVAAGCAIAAARRVHWAAGAVVALAALLPAAAGVIHYESAYAKSDYREMSAWLNENAGPNDLALLEGPRQHLLWRYYGPALEWQPVPLMDLPEFWPANGPPVVPEESDDQIQEALRDHEFVWLVLTGEDEVDLGEFVPKYLRAVAYLDGCRAWLDVRLCRFRSPGFVNKDSAFVPAGATPVHVGAALWLEDVRVGDSVTLDGQLRLPVELTWRAESVPAQNLKASLRLADAGGGVLTQTDDLPIGPLLPPVTWQAGDVKPGYFVLELPPGQVPGRYSLLLSMYNESTGAPTGEPIVLGAITLPPAP